MSTAGMQQLDANISRFWIEKVCSKRKKRLFVLAKPYRPGLKPRLLEKKDSNFVFPTRLLNPEP